MRTDRSVTFFDGDDNPNVHLLRDILLTYSFYNFDLGYCQVITSNMEWSFLALLVVAWKCMILHLCIVIKLWLWFALHKSKNDWKAFRNATEVKAGQIIYWVCWCHMHKNYWIIMKNFMVIINWSKTRKLIKCSILIFTSCFEIHVKYETKAGFYLKFPMQL